MARRERKQPQQARAQQTVRAILEATIQILENEGLDAATTTRIAEVAGVSIGSLYQYFSHRDAILNALQEREFERTLALIGKVLADGNLDSDPTETVRATMLAYLLERPPGLDAESLIDELTHLITGYLLGSTADVSRTGERTQRKPTSPSLAVGARQPRSDGSRAGPPRTTSSLRSQK